MSQPNDLWDSCDSRKVLAYLAGLPTEKAGFEALDLVPILLGVIERLSD